MAIIDKKDSKYSQIVEDTNESEYNIHTDKMQDGETIVCPHDPDMTVTKCNDGTVLVGKKCFSSKPFSK